MAGKGRCHKCGTAVTVLASESYGRGGPPVHWDTARQVKDLERRIEELQELRAWLLLRKRGDGDE